MLDSKVVNTIEGARAPSLVASSPLRALRSALAEANPIALVAVTVAMLAAVATGIASAVPVAAAIAVAGLGPAIVVDIVERRLPDQLVAGAALLGVCVAVLEAATGTSINLFGASLGVVAFAGPLLVMHLISPAAMGFGDVKAGVVLGAALGLIDPRVTLAALAVGAFGAALVGLALRRRTIAFGPGLMGGAVVLLILVSLGATGEAAQTSSALVAAARAVVG